MSESLTQLYLSNPALASAIRRRQDGAQMQQQGMDTTPTSGWGALARLAQAYVGTRDVNRVDDQIKSIGDAQTAARTKAEADEAALLFGGAPKPAGTAPSAIPLPQTSAPTAPAAPAAGASADGLPPTPELSTIASGSGARFQVAAPYADRFQGLVNDLEAAGYKPEGAQSGGYNRRFIAGTTTPSEHSHGAAIDVNWTRNPRGGAGDIPPELARSLAAKYNLTWGGDWSGNTRDPMHFEVPSAGRQQVAANTTAGTATDAGGSQSPLAAAYLPAARQQPAAGMVPPAIAAIPEPMQRAQAIQALALKYASSPDPMLKSRAPLLMQMAGQLLQVNKFVPDTVGGVSGQRNVMSGEWKPMIAGTGRTATNANGDVILIPPGGGQPQVIAPNRSGVTGTSDLANASRAINDIAPKIQAGTATPQEIQNYNTAVTLFQGHKTVTDPANNRITQVPERPLPPGIPAVPGAEQHGAVAPLTQGGFGAKTAAGIQESQGKDDAKSIAEEQAKIASTHGTLATTQTIRSTLPQVATGVAAEQRLRAQQIFTALGVPDATAKEWTGTSAPMGEILQKKLFELSTGAVRGMGAREPGSVVAMFAKNYPNMTSQNMTIDAMTRLLDMDQTYKEAEIGARGGHLNSSVARLSSGQPYQGMSGYAAPDPRPFQAAALAAGGMPFDVWSRGLTPEQQTAALKLAAHVWPDASALDAKGVRHTFQQPKPQ